MRELIKPIYAFFLQTLTAVGGVDWAKRVDSFLRFRRKLNLKNPQTLADKVSYLALHKNTASIAACTDKWAVREYIAQKGLKDCLIPTVGGPWNRVEEIDFNALPDKFIFKATHGCKMNYVVTDKKQLDLTHCRHTLRTWLGTTYGTYSVEPHYAQIPPRIYAEELLEPVSALKDYKLHCLNGKACFILVCSDRQSSGKSMQVTLNLFDTHWQSLNQYLQSFEKEQVGLGTDISRPARLQEMIEIAQKLSQDFQFVRVDLYEHNNRIYFGELTFSPACGVFPYFTDAFNEKMGKELTL